ncbi:ATP-binding protein [Actinomadura rupiterrae]|uniref:ATP-binding protein n=1 Tax=Actinomadura rupiterrae TaxID=559627 RepID=UPI0020A47013|nr:ATP-binding protein [Actinomadura rupiterrae]MCP2340185.1 anti-sigma regulatory factor (Ser/Thr protein kinase) [Actinomadura rupiterrae]
MSICVMTGRGGLPGTFASVEHARHLIADALAGCLPGEVLDDVLLAVGELAANAVRHTASGHPGGTFTVLAGIKDGLVQVAVLDQGAPGCPAITTSTELFAPSGRGLAMLAELGEWGWIGSARARLTWWRCPLTPAASLPAAPGGSAAEAL